MAKPGLPRQEPLAPPASEYDELVLTLDKTTHAVVKIAKLDATGQRHEISDDDGAKLTGKAVMAELVHALEEAFQAGLAEGLGAGGDEEAVDDDVLMRLLVSRNAEHDVRLLGPRGMLLRPLLLRRLLQHHVTAAPTAEQQRRTPISELPRNGSTSNSSNGSI
jgi:hypothetical protein